MVFQTTTNHENISRDLSYVLGVRHVDEGRFILARSEPEYEYDLDVDGHNELLPLPQKPTPRETIARIGFQGDARTVGRRRLEGIF